MAAPLLEVLQKHRAALRPFVPWVDQVATAAQARRFLQETALFNRGGQKLILFMYFRKKLIGSAGLMRIDHENLAAEVGFWLGTRWEGQGLMRRTLEALINKAFTDLSLQRLEMRILAQNQRALRLANHLDFQQEGVLRRAVRQENKYHDLVVYSILYQEWQQY